MSIHQTYAVLGLGRYGFAVAKELVDNGAEVLAVDQDEIRVNAAAAVLPLCKCADVTDPDVINQLGISNIDVVIIAMANKLEASVMAITLCKEAGVPLVIAKCGSEVHKKIFRQIGADRVVFPENESGLRLAKNLLSAGFVDMIDLNENISVVELEIKPDWIGKNLLELDLRRKYSLNVMAIREEDQICIDIDPKKPLQKEMKLIVIADTAKLQKLK